MKIEDKLKQRDIKPTAMRELVYEVLDKNKKALSLYEIEKQFDNVERSTIFRTLKTFQDHLLIHSVDDGTGAVKYALCDDDCTCQPDDLHVHFLCNKCGQTHCLRDMSIPKMDLPKSFSFESANFVVKGTCSNCK
ncbi:Fur family transcriptional regulator [Flammeovirga kamogawensis]|uniref:Transcriptional repressor n=1 Tax=Flammeovirga kamogawensis TaxID=373891 RepID=A0ABX8H5Z5_9BACT|nr:transcriptional repressor [Flammeovirga kamogawensis]MBB6463837.1 Fur family ferric uptake transcriptional regulator [Flammeovirga kamogawensis]QWG10762.1 transcriptional repressor [Flammeovirga kamogawensis]TRX63206.1 transcriptional repressor [Flammeovirga kamogawensis]